MLYVVPGVSVVFEVSQEANGNWQAHVYGAYGSFVIQAAPVDTHLTHIVNYLESSPAYRKGFWLTSLRAR